MFAVFSCGENIAVLVYFALHPVNSCRVAWISRKKGCPVQTVLLLDYFTRSQYTATRFVPLRVQVTSVRS